MQSSYDHFVLDVVDSVGMLANCFQVLLSQVHRLRALELLGRFLDLGPWAVSLVRNHPCGVEQQQLVELELQQNVFKGPPAYKHCLLMKTKFYRSIYEYIFHQIIIGNLYIRATCV